MSAHSDGSEQPLRPTLDQMRQLALYGALSEDAMQFLAARLEIHTVEAGKLVFREGDAGRALFVLIDGEMEVLKSTASGASARVALLGPGDWIGEMSLVDIQPRSASVQATARTQLIVVTAADLDALYRRDLKAYTMLVLNLARELSRRLRVADALLADIATSVVTRR